MRGGLGRTLLTVFLVLTIGPLSLVSFYAITRTRHEIEQLSLENLQAVVQFVRSEAYYQVERHRALLLQSALGREVAPELTYWILDGQGQLLKSARGDGSLPQHVLNMLRSEDVLLGEQEGGLYVWIKVPVGSEKLAVAAVPVTDIFPVSSVSTSQGMALFLVWEGQAWPLLTPQEPLPSDVAATVASPTGGTEIVGKEAPWMVAAVPFRDGAVLVGAQPTRSALATSDSLAGALIAATLAVALLTTVAAAVMIRRITRPVFELTRTAVLISQGDLNRRALVNRTDELGILAFAFNTMAERLQDLLETLEQRVVERTEQLARANALLERRARYLELSAEVGREIGRLPSSGAVVEQAVRLIRERFGFEAVHIWLFRRQPSDGQEPSLEERGRAGQPPWPDRIAELAQAVAARGKPLWREVEGKAVLGFPLRLSTQIIGVLVLVSQESFVEGDLQTLQVLADQVTVALENARASEMERAALEKLQQLERRRSVFLGQMSHELSTALNSIIGFSTLLLKGVDGPLTENQKSDLTYINRNGQHLLALLDRMLELLDEQSDERSVQPPELVVKQEL